MSAREVQREVQRPEGDRAPATSASSLEVREVQPGSPAGKSSVDWRDVGRRLPVASAVLATAFVAVTAFVLAYDGSRGAAGDAGISAAGWYPFCIEGVIVCASIGTVVMRGHWYPWVVLLTFTAVSTAANVLHAWTHPGSQWWSLAFAAVPPLALPICVHLMLRIVHSATPGPATGSATAPPADVATAPRALASVADEPLRPVAPVASRRSQTLAAAPPSRSQVSAATGTPRRAMGPCVEGCDRHDRPVSYDTRRRCADRLAATA